MIKYGIAIQARSRERGGEEDMKTLADKIAELTGEENRKHPSTYFLNRTWGIVSGLFLGFGLAFFSSNITGNAIASINNNSNLIGGISFVIGIFGLLFVLRKK